LISNEKIWVEDGITHKTDEWEERIPWYSHSLEKDGHLASVAWNAEDGRENAYTAHKKCNSCRKLLNQLVCNK
jgi:hypothetical protein